MYKILFFYTIAGAIVNSALVDQWYKIQYLKNEFYSPYQGRFAFLTGVTITITLWPFLTPYLLIRNFKEIKRLENMPDSHSRSYSGAMIRLAINDFRKDNQ